MKRTRYISITFKIEVDDSINKNMDDYIYRQAKTFHKNFNEKINDYKACTCLESGVEISDLRI